MAIPPPRHLADNCLSMLPARSRPMTYETDSKPLGQPQLNKSWYSIGTHYTGLYVPDSVPSYGSSPQSSNGSLLGTPCQATGSVAEISDGLHGSSRFHHNGSPMIETTPTNPANSLGLVLAESRKASPLGGVHGPNPSGLAVSVDYQQEGQNNHDISHWHDITTGYQIGVGTSCDLYIQTPSRSQSQYRARSYSDNGSPEALPSSPSTQFSSESSPFGSHRSLPVAINRCSSLPSLVSGEHCSLPLPTPQWDNGQNNYGHVSSHYQNAGMMSFDEGSFVRHHQSPQQQWLSPPETHVELRRTPPSPSHPNGSAGSSLFQARVGSDRTRAISRSRRTNPDKKLFICDIPGCGATITSKHNFKSHRNSHFGIKPHQCGQGACKKHFGTTAEVKRHRASHCQYRSSSQ